MKNQMWKKGVCLGMAAMMTAGMLAGCGESSESKDTAMVQTGEDGVVESGRYTLDADTPAWKLDTKEDTTLTWYVNAEWWNTEWGNDVVTKQIQKDMNVNIDFVVGDDTNVKYIFCRRRYAGHHYHFRCQLKCGTESGYLGICIAGSGRQL